MTRTHLHSPTYLIAAYMCVVTIGDKSALASAKYRKKTLPMETFAQKGLLSTPLAAPWDKKIYQPLMKFLAFPTLFLPMKRSRDRSHASLTVDTRLTGARRHPCASQPDNKFSAALPLALASAAGSCYVITGSFIVMRMVRLEFYDWRWGRGANGKKKK